MHVHVQLTDISFEDGDTIEGTVVASVDCSSWSADRFRSLWEFLHEDPEVPSRPQVHSPTATSAARRAHVGAVEACGPCGRVSSGVDHVEA